jgi:hypothetical protein
MTALTLSLALLLPADACSYAPTREPVVYAYQVPAGSANDIHACFGGGGFGRSFGFGLGFGLGENFGGNQFGWGGSPWGGGGYPWWAYQRPSPWGWGGGGFPWWLYQQQSFPWWLYSNPYMGGGGFPWWLYGRGW